LVTPPGVFCDKAPDRIGACVRTPSDFAGPFLCGNLRGSPWRWYRAIAKKQTVDTLRKMLGNAWRFMEVVWDGAIVVRFRKNAALSSSVRGVVVLRCFSADQRVIVGNGRWKDFRLVNLGRKSRKDHAVASRRIGTAESSRIGAATRFGDDRSYGDRPP
jgi:hypothetical protein